MPEEKKQMKNPEVLSEINKLEKMMKKSKRKKHKRKAIDRKKIERSYKRKIKRKVIW